MSSGQKKVPVTYNDAVPERAKDVEEVLWDLVLAQSHILGRHGSCNKYCNSDISLAVLKEISQKGEAFFEQPTQVIGPSHINVQKYVVPEARKWRDDVESVPDEPRLPKTESLTEAAQSSKIGEIVQEFSEGTLSVLVAGVPGNDPSVLDLPLKLGQGISGAQYAREKGSIGTNPIYDPIKDLIGADAAGWAFGGAGGAVGYLNGKFIGYGKEYFKIRRPLQRRLDKFRLELREGKVEPEFSEASDGDIDMVVRKIFHYMDRVADRSKKFNELFKDVMQRGGKGENGKPEYPFLLSSCDEAVKLVRYYLKVEHYGEKLKAYLIYLDIYLDALRKMLEVQVGVPWAATEGEDGLRINDSQGEWVASYEKKVKTKSLTDIYAV